MIRSFLGLFIVTFLISGCYPIETTTTHNKAWSDGNSTSEPIYLNFRDNKKSSFHFYLSHRLSSEDYMLRVRWNTINDDLIYNGLDTTMKFLIDGAEIITLSPVISPKIVAYNIETRGHQEDATFKLTYLQLKKLAYAKEVEVELSGKYITVIGQFNKRHTFKAFRNFINNT